MIKMVDGLWVSLGLSHLVAFHLEIVICWFMGHPRVPRSELLTV